MQYLKWWATVAWWSLSCNPKVAGSRPGCIRKGIQCKTNCPIFCLVFLIKANLEEERAKRTYAIA